MLQLDTPIHYRVRYTYPTWVVTFQGYGPVYSVTITKYGLPVLRYNYGNPLEVVLGQQISFTRR